MHCYDLLIASVYSAVKLFDLRLVLRGNRQLFIFTHPRYSEQTHNNKKNQAQPCDVYYFRPLPSVTSQSSDVDGPAGDVTSAQRQPRGTLGGDTSQLMNINESRAAQDLLRAAPCSRWQTSMLPHSHLAPLFQWCSECVQTRVPASRLLKSKLFSRKSCLHIHQPVEPGPSGDKSHLAGRRNLAGNVGTRRWQQRECWSLASILVEIRFRFWSREDEAATPSPNFSHLIPLSHHRCYCRRKVMYKRMIWKMYVFFFICRGARQSL